MSASVVACRNVSVQFGAFRAIRDINLEFASGKVTALIGPNGAGKTTLLNVLSGLQKPTTGEVFLTGKDVTRMSTSRRALCGMSRSFQIVNVFPGMSVKENIRLAVQRKELKRIVPWRPIDSFTYVTAEVVRYLEVFDLTKLADQLAGQLSHGEQRGLEIALSIVGEPRVLLLDEPLAGVGHADLPRFIDLLRRVCHGRTTVLVEHNMDVVMGLADEIVCLVSGAVLARGAPEQIRNDDRVRAAYLGT